MIVGSPAIVAVESVITQAYADLGWRALGFFVVHVGGKEYGVRSPDASMLACSFDAVQERLTDRGKHQAPFAANPDAAGIADAFRRAVYAEVPSDERFFGMSQAEITELIHSSRLLWAPDGDEAFDDGSYILQFDVHDRVRVIAFKRGEGIEHDPLTLSDIWMASDDFYDVLEQWRRAFEAEWRSALTGIFRGGD